MAVDATAMAGRSLRFDAAEKRRVRAGCSSCRRRLKRSARLWRIVSITGYRVRQWRFTAAADRSAPAPFCWLSRVAARIVAPPQPPPSHRPGGGGSSGGPAGRRRVRGV